ncbi:MULTISPECIES: hypothetical protein [Klebsiella/Raoultella group]|uniref:hypothetical protein n=1 Tax=Klebsiella/Raoultella group TaxID=2890311 RepID=UPI000808F1BF|nr:MULTISPECIES: hypothetical protein [Klebsiella/Raoultella group]RDB00598.1 hypothetical protein DVB85_10245 [Klebsiella oxytoca]ARS97900.1 hypothetical protein B8O09_01380 [Klebsiella pneumoniae]AYC85043.1 hypothetical protein CJ257_19520 [Klebsiella pneumoniae]AYC90352.1 hypothetical protein CJ256_19520 [Klebsiella pneumoniae]AYD30615.1 hypothetical protein CJ259_19500 [Klebsiella pneumoniae]
MISVRLPKNIDDQIGYIAYKTGETKNSIICKALALYLENVHLASTPLPEGFQEESPEDMGAVLSELEENKRSEFIDQSLEIRKWINDRMIWSNNPKDLSGNPVVNRGRNLVIGFQWPDCSSGDEIMLFYRHLGGASIYGLGDDQIRATTYQKWKDSMVVVDIK